MTVALTPYIEAMIQEKVESGMYTDPNEVIQEAPRLLDERDREQRLRAELATCLAHVERGETIP